MGASVALVGRTVKADRKHSGDSLVFGGVDLSRREAATLTMAAIFEQCGRIDGLANLAGGFHWEKLEGSTVEMWDSLFTLNVKTAAVSCESVLPYMLKTGGGAIVNIGAMGAIKAACGMGAYAASKAGVVKLTEALADELKDRRIRVNAVLPSILDTAKNRADMPKGDFSRRVSLAAVADVIAFLVSDEARAVTGAALPVAGCVQ